MKIFKKNWRPTPKNTKCILSTYKGKPIRMYIPLWLIQKKVSLGDGMQLFLGVPPRILYSSKGTTINNIEPPPGLQIFFKIGGPKWPMKQKRWINFWNDGPNHIKLTTVNIWVVYFTYTLTQTLECIHADYTVKPVLSSHSKKKTNYRLMQVKGIADCSKGSILQSFPPSLSYHLLLRFLFCIFWEAA